MEIEWESIQEQIDKGLSILEKLERLDNMMASGSIYLTNGEYTEAIVYGTMPEEIEPEFYSMVSYGFIRPNGSIGYGITAVKGSVVDWVITMQTRPSEEMTTAIWITNISPIYEDEYERLVEHITEKNTGQ